tara:strand:+ start:690 stop:899 length:210 start_codon:yes stop_codon:yes gene_type:complete
MSKEINLNVLKHRMLTEIDKLDKELSDLDTGLSDLDTGLKLVISYSGRIKSQLAALKQDILERLDIPSP